MNRHRLDPAFEVLSSLKTDKTGDEIRVVGLVTVRDSIHESLNNLLHSSIPSTGLEGQNSYPHPDSSGLIILVL